MNRNKANKILEIQKLCVQYGNISVVKNINFSVFDNEIFVLIGPSGSGKSTILHSITGLLEKSAKLSGKIIYKNKIINSMLPENRNIPLLFQNLSLFMLSQ